MSSSKSKINKRNFSEMKTEQFTYEWTIKNFNYLYKKPGECVQSPVFSFGSKTKINWFLGIYPNGVEKTGEGFMSLLLYWKHDSIINGQYKISLINKEQKKLVEMQGDLSMKLIKDDGVGFHYFIKRDRVLKEAADFLPDNSLTIHCEIILFTEDISPTIEEKKRKLEINSEPSLLEKLFLEESLSDIKLIITSSGQSLPAHKCVLAASSPVFETMFTHNVHKQMQGEVKIDDAEYEIIKEMLRFVYLNQVDNLSSIVFELVKLANKYQLAELIKFCRTELMNQIRINNVLNVITIAERYHMEDLKKYAIDFGSLHLKEIVNLNDFDSSMYPQAMQSILKAFGKK